MMSLTKKIIFSIFIVIVVLHLSSINTIQAAECNCIKNKKIAIIAPVQHQAIDDIIGGMKAQLKENNSERIVVFNAMGDPNNISASITQAINNDDYGVLMPIGTVATHLALNSTSSKPIIGLGVDISEAQRQILIKEGHVNFTNVQDAIPVKNILSLIEKLGKKNILLVYSNDARIHEAVVEIGNVAKDYDIKIKKFNIINPSDIYGIKTAIEGADCVLVLKDNVVVSMINVLVVAAHEHSLPVITSDEGSVISGADIAIGVKESDVGSSGADILNEMISGKKIVDIPVRLLLDIGIFYKINNSNPLDRQQVADVAKVLNYNVSLVE